ncbi:MAG TPA: 2OG-Fe(II) oxygenase family protein [Pseudonocardia sp.]|nr:2OG-Fe(II) oxygenase family protein [Pseudonocardia sp.]
MADRIPAPAAERAAALDVPAAPSEVTAAVQVIDIAPALEPGRGPATGSGPGSAAIRSTGSLAVASALVDSFRQTGFAVVTGHRVPAALCHTMSEVSTEFFALPLAEKLAVAFPAPEIIRGYEPVPAATGADRITSAVESLLINRLSPPDDFPIGGIEHRLWRWPNVWPERPARLRQVWERYYREMEQLGDQLLELVAIGLGLPAGWFAGYFDRHFSNLAVNHYPPQPGSVDDPGRARPRNRPHTDHGALTLLYRPAEPGGLEVYAGGQWWRVPFLPGSLVLNVGDILERWTDGALRATPHRVVAPVGAAARAGRQSIVYFQQPNPDAVIAPAPALAGPGGGSRYRPVLAGAHVSRKELGHATLAALAPHLADSHLRTP